MIGYEEAMLKWRRVAFDYRDTGASDSEPEGVLERLVLAARGGMRPSIPRSGGDWRLFKPDKSLRAERVQEAARELARAAAAVLSCVQIGGGT